MTTTHPEETIQIRKFDMNTLKPDRKVIIIGPSGSGKTTLTVEICKYMKKKNPKSLGLAGSEASMEYLNEIMHPFVVHDCTVDEEVIYDKLQKLLDSQKRLCEKYPDKKNRHIGVSVVMDDCAFHPKLLLRTNKLMRFLFMNGRNRDIFLILSLQYCMDMPPVLRSNADYLFIFFDPILENKQKLYKKFFGMFPNQAAFNKVYDSCTQNYECLVLDKTIKSGNIEDMVFYYKAHANQPPFKMGSRRFLRYCDKKFDPEKNSIFEPIPVTNSGYNKKKNQKEEPQVETIVIKRKRKTEKKKKEGKSVSYRYKIT